MSTQLEPEAVSPSRSIPRHPQLAEQPNLDTDGPAEDPPPPPTSTGNRGQRPQPVVQPSRQPVRR